MTNYSSRFRERSNKRLTRTNVVRCAQALMCFVVFFNFFVLWVPVRLAPVRRFDIVIEAVRDRCGAGARRRGRCRISHGFGRGRIGSCHSLPGPFRDGRLFAAPGRHHVARRVPGGARRPAGRRAAFYARRMRRVETRFEHACKRARHPKTINICGSTYTRRQRLPRDESAMTR